MKTPTLAQLRVLQSIGTFGYLSTKDFARLNWSRHEAHSAHVMSQTVLSKLTVAGYILARDLRQRPGEKVPPVLKSGAARGYVLTQKGAAELNDLYADAWSAQAINGSSRPTAWFADGYNLSLAGHITRAPLIDLCYELQAGSLNCTFVGQRGLGRNFLELSHLAHFEAVMFNEAGMLSFGIYLAHPQVDVAAKEVVKLASGMQPFLICCTSPRRLSCLQRWRANTNPNFAGIVNDALPSGVQA